MKLETLLISNVDSIFFCRRSKSAPDILEYIHKKKLLLPLSHFCSVYIQTHEIKMGSYYLLKYREKFISAKRECDAAVAAALVPFQAASHSSQNFESDKSVVVKILIN